MQIYTYLLATLALAFTACSPKNQPVNPPEQPEPDPIGTVYYTPSDEIFPNPERGFYVQITTRSSDLKQFSANSVRNLRSQAITLILHMYYLEDFYESDISEAYLQTIRANMQALRDGGGKCIPRFAYTSDASTANKDLWDAPEPWVQRHLDQLAPILQEYADVIYCVQAGFVGVWGEWYYTTHFVHNPQTAEDFQVRKRLIDKLLEVVPDSRQIALRTPEYKWKYLGISAVDTLTADMAYDGSSQARLAGHNDCFASSANDVGTYTEPLSRDFWAADTRFASMGGESCAMTAYGKGDRAVAEMERYHFTYLNRDYYRELLTSWVQSNHMDDIKRRLGYRFVLDKMWYNIASSTADSDARTLTITLTLHNEGFAAPTNPRAVELILISTHNAQEKHILPIADADPRFWLPSAPLKIDLQTALPAPLQGEYLLYLNLPDPEPTLHDDPRFAIRCANTNIYNSETGYNQLGTITIDSK